MIKLRSNPFTLLIHLALAIIVAGALVTHFFGIQGTLTLTDGADPVTCFDKTSGPGDGSFPFAVSLVSADVEYYTGTTTAMDYRSVISIADTTLTVAMNAVAELDGWRFYQSGMGPDTSTFSICHDPWGIGITYTGYILLGIGMVGFFFMRKSMWRSLLLILLVPAAACAAESPKTMSRPLARNFGKVYVYWNDRVSPLQTMAVDVTTKLYGSSGYSGHTPEQVLSGWLFYYDEWLRDYNATHPEPTTERERKNDAECRALIRWLGTGEAFRIYPYHSASGRLEWLSLSGRRPSKMSDRQWRFMLNGVRNIEANLRQGRNITADEDITHLIEGQRLYAGADNLPSQGRFAAERFYNNYVSLFPAAVIMLIVVAAMLWISLAKSIQHCRPMTAIAVAAATWLAAVLALRGYVGGHVPLSNGCETMLFMAFAAAAGSAVCRKPLLKGALMLVAAMAALVAAMAGSKPQIGALMPVLASPLLAVHVALVMCSYVLFMLMAVLSATGLAKRSMLQPMARVNAIVLTPAVFLLAAGIFTGAVWANQSWGRYWGWDPKETCALVTMLIYALPIHRVSIKAFRRPRVLCIYLLVAILAVLFTYFGANYLLPGLHSYA